MSEPPILPDPDATGGLFPDEGLFGLETTVEDAAAVVVPVPFEGTVSYGTGTSDGPAAVLRASRQVERFCVQTGRPDRAGIAMLDIPSDVRSWSDEAQHLVANTIRAGGGDGSEDPTLARVNELCANMNAWVRATCDGLLEQGKLVFTLGGDHSVAFGALEAHAARYPRMGVLHLDAHFDMRPAYEGFTWSHASVIYNALERIDGISRFVHVGVRDFCEAEYRRSSESHGRSMPYLDQAIADRMSTGEPWRDIATEIVKRLPRDVYITFDVDFLEPSLCPGTGTPVPGGANFHRAVSLLDAIAHGGRRIVGADLCEVAPSPGDREWNGNVGARLLYKMIGFALKSR